MLTAYQQEQLEAFRLTEALLTGLTPSRLSKLRIELERYLAYRARVDRFLETHFSQICSASCYQSQRSACCSKDGVIIFFADVLINALCSDERRRDEILRVLCTPHQGPKCLYLTDGGCLLQVKPLVCALFLCDSAKAAAFQSSHALAQEWADLVHQSRQFKWPDRPVLFDRLEEIAIAAGFSCSLMYFHNSPGLLRVKQRAGLVAAPSRAAGNRRFKR